MIDDFDDTTGALKIFLSAKKSTDLHMASTGMASAGDPYSAMTGVTSAGAMLGSTGLSPKLTIDSSLAMTGVTSAGAMLGSTGLSPKLTIDSSLAMTGVTSAGATFGSTGLSPKLAVAPYATITGITGAGDLFGTNVPGDSSVNPCPWRTGTSSARNMFTETSFTVKSSLDSCSPIAGVTSVRNLLSSTGFGYPSVDPCSLNAGTSSARDMFTVPSLTVKSSMDSYSATTGMIDAGNMFSSSGFSPKVAVDSYPVITGILGARDMIRSTSPLKTSVDSIRVNTGMVKAGDVLGSGFGYLQAVDAYSATTGSVSLILKSPTTLDLVSTSSIQEMLRGPALGFESSVYAYSSPENLFKSDTGVSKWRRFEVLLPLQFNDGKNVPAKMIEEAKSEFLAIFSALSCDTQGVEGLWWHGAVLFRDNLTRILVDAPDLSSTRRRVKEYKERWRCRLRQIELWVTSYDIRVE